MSDAQSPASPTTVRSAGVATPSKPALKSDDDAPPRRLLSLSSQVRREEAADEGEKGRRHDGERRGTQPLPRRHDPDDDPMAHAMALLSGIDENVREAEKRPASPAPDAPEAASVQDRGSQGRWTQDRTQARTKARTEDRGAEASAGAGETPAAGSAPTGTRGAPPSPAAAAPATALANDDPGEEDGWFRQIRETLRRAEPASRLDPQAAESGATEPAPSDDEWEESRYEEVIRREDASPVVGTEVQRRPARRLYSLQEVHERTGIPYATLALYAVSHADRIPSLGERRSPAYPREGLEELCRIHAEKTPGWEPPAVGTEAGWDDEAGLARRIDALAAGLDSLGDDLEEIRQLVERGWSAEVSLFD